MTREEADAIFPLVYQRAQRIAHEYATPEVMASLNPTQQAILIDMAYNLGETGLNKFVDMRDALLRGDREGVRREMKDSKWYEQTKRRGKHHVENW
jgi:GH24 family phage-related lysozyme (muramidase)